ncbi:MAG: hypothetical protein KJZ72_04370 [Anaerolineales bacterium]|nr:hypothetical protein [Anaerolineales bacterium]
MKTLFRIAVILLMAAIVAGGLYLLVENTAFDMVSEAEGHQRPAMTDGTANPSMERPEGGEDHHSASLTRGLSEMFVTLGKLAAITIVILLLQKGFSLLRAAKLKAQSS